MIFLLDSVGGGGGGGKQLATDFIICPILCCLILVFEYQVLLVGLGIVVRYNGPNFFRVSGRCSSHSHSLSSQTISRDPSLASLRRPHLLRRAAGWISQPSLSRFRRIFFEFYHLVPVCHLENDEIFDINVVIVFLPSEAHRLGEIFLSLRLSTRGHCGIRLPSLHKIASSAVSLYAWPVLCLGVYLFPGGEVVSLLRRAFLATLCELTTGYNARWIVFVTKIAIYGCLHYSQRVGIVVCTIFLRYFNVKLV